MASLWLQELGLTQPLLAGPPEGAIDLLRQPGPAQEARRGSSAPDDDEAALDLKMMAVLVGSPVAEPVRRAARPLPRPRCRMARFDLSEPRRRPSRPSRRWGCWSRFWELMRQRVRLRRRHARLSQACCVDSSSPSSSTRRMTPRMRRPGPPPAPAGRPAQRGRLPDSVARLAAARPSSYDAAAAAVAAELKVGEPLATLDLRRPQGCLHLLGGREARRRPA